MTLLHHLPVQPAVPTINLNGTEGQSLFNANRTVCTAVYEAEQAMHQIAPHGRDYIGQPEEFAKARDEYYARLSALRQIMVELDAIAISINRQINRH